MQRLNRSLWKAAAAAQTRRYTTVGRRMPKESTGLVGLAVENDPVDKLYSYYDRCLRALGRLPAESVYRQSATAVTEQRLGILCDAKTVEEVEERVNAGQIEELIVQAKNELSLIEKMEALRPWESLETPSPADQWKYSYGSASSSAS